MGENLFIEHMVALIICLLHFIAEFWCNYTLYRDYSIKMPYLDRNTYILPWIEWLILKSLHSILYLGYDPFQTKRRPIVCQHNKTHNPIKKSFKTWSYDIDERLSNGKLLKLQSPSIWDWEMIYSPFPPKTRPLIGWPSRSTN